MLGEDEDFPAGFIREARSAARLSHPGVVAVYDQGDDGALAMEYVPGHTLRDLIEGVPELRSSKSLTTSNDGRRPSILLPFAAVTPAHPPLAEPGDPAVRRDLCRQESGLSDGSPDAR